MDYKRKPLKVDNSTVIMDIIDVKDEITRLKNYYEDLVHIEEKGPKKYYASYSAVALAEALRIIKLYMKHPTVMLADSKEEKQDGSN